MTEVTAKRPISTTLSALLTALCVGLVLASPATGRPYTVVSCDSAGLFGYSSAAWTPFDNVGGAYATCPSGNGMLAGISNRLTGRTYAGFNLSGHAFTAPPGTTITHLRWAGRLARANCTWGTYIRALPSGIIVLGLPNGQLCGNTEWDSRGWPVPVAIPAGTTRLEQLVVCGSSQCPPGATMHSYDVEVTVDDPIPPSISLSGRLASGRWVSGRVGVPDLNVSIADSSGVQRIESQVGGRPEVDSYFCDWSQPRPCPGSPTVTVRPALADLPDGRHALKISGVDAGGNLAATTHELYVDNTPPDPVVPELAGGEVWRQANSFDVGWPPRPSGGAPVTRAHWKLCRADSTCPVRGHRDGVEIRELRRLQVPEPGEYRLHVWLEDEAGNQREGNAAVSVPLRFDPEPPRVAFAPVDPADPLRVAVNVDDKHSGLAGGEIEMRPTRSMTWHGLPTARDGSTLVAYVDDERFRHGAYEFRARAIDHAGNEASTGRRTDGSAATLQLPARINTRLVVGLPRFSPRRRLGRRNGGRRATRRTRKLDTKVISRFRHKLRLHGRLTNADGQPIGGATVEAREKQDDGGLLPVGLATTSEKGTFTYVVRATKSRQLLFRYEGSRRIGGATSLFEMSVPAVTAIRVDRSRVLNGQQVTFSGRVATRPLPPAGKLIEMQAHFRGRWRTFSTVRSSSGGRWSFPYRFGATLGRVTYRFRARLPSEGGYPFADGFSGVAKVVVLGPGG